MLLATMIAASIALAGQVEGQTMLVPDQSYASSSVGEDSCEALLTLPPLKQALRPVCMRMPPSCVVGMRKAIIIGFVGGFVKDGDRKHPEVQYAALLRANCPAGIQADVFANHHGNEAFRRILQLLDTNRDGAISAVEREQAGIIIYGHSWGASQTVTLARKLDRMGIPVLLTVQIDSVHKPGQEDTTIPPNVKNAINFYQTRGLIHGQETIRAADPNRTHIIGNFEMTYRHGEIDCANYSWMARHFNKPHHEIENDPHVWSEIALLVESQLSQATSLAQASLPSK